LEDCGRLARLEFDSSSTERKGNFVSDQDRVRPSEPESDVEAHKKQSAAQNEEPRAEGESDDDVEAHKVRPA
jgi:hypothetical protein